ncbi:MAG: hypothetical protein OCD03_13240 [Hyphomicrobiales bacterium]
MPKFYPAAKEPNISGRFSLMSVVNAKKSKEQKKTVYENVLVCEAKAGGNSRDVEVKIVRGKIGESLKDRFADAWVAYENGDDEKDGNAFDEVKKDLTAAKSAKTKAENKLDEKQVELHAAKAEIEALKKAAKTPEGE